MRGTGHWKISSTCRDKKLLVEWALTSGNQVNKTWINWKHITNRAWQLSLPSCLWNKIWTTVYNCVQSDCPCWQTHWLATDVTFVYFDKNSNKSGIMHGKPFKNTLQESNNKSDSQTWDWKEILSQLGCSTSGIIF